MRHWRKVLFGAITRNPASPIEHFKLPDDRTTTVGASIGV